MSDRKNLSVGFRTPFAVNSKEKITRSHSQVDLKNSPRFSCQEDKSSLDALGDKPPKSLIREVNDEFLIIPPHPQSEKGKSGIKLDQTKSGSGLSKAVSEEEIFKADATLEKFSRMGLPKNSFYGGGSEEPLFPSDSPLGKIFARAHDHVQTSMIHPDKSELGAEFWPASLNNITKK